jgi:hypothetical protein
MVASFAPFSFSLDFSEHGRSSVSDTRIVKPYIRLWIRFFLHVTYPFSFTKLA